MTPPDSTPNSVRRIVLPSGRTIEVVRFGEAESVRELHSCPRCESPLMQPVAWSETSDGSGWDLTLECPNCWLLEAGTYSQAEVSALENQLDEGVAAIVRDLQRLTHANMAEQIDRFVTALHADVILPEDF